MRTTVAGCLALLAALVPIPAHAGGAVPVVVLNGKGWGHGVGMAQDGAYWMSRAGATTNQILGHFYPGAGLGRASGNVRVIVLSGGGPDTVVGFPGGGQVRDDLGPGQSPGFPVAVPAGGQVRLHADGGHYSVQPLNFSLPAPPTVLAVQSIAYRPSESAFQTTGTTVVTLPGATTTTIPAPTTTTTGPPSSTTPPTTSPPPTTATSAPPAPTTTAPAGPPQTQPAPAPPGPGTPAPSPSAPPVPPGPRVAAVTSSRPLWAVPSGAATLAVPARGALYRGVLQTGWGRDGIQLVNQLDVETYLKGMGEVLDPSWPPAALRAQAIAARTYALRAMSIGGQICDDQRCQVYLGAQVEYAAMNAAVDASAHQVLAYGGQLVSALYSANAGGFSADPVEAFGPTGTYPYLRPAPYTTSDPLPWSTTIALRDVGARLGYRGQISNVRVTRTGPSGRAEEVTLDGSRGSLAVAGYTFAAQLGLRSTLFAATLGSAANAPAPPPAQSLLQALPGATVGAGGGGPASGLGLGARRIGNHGRARRSLAVIVALVGVLATTTAIGRVFGEGDEGAALTRKGRPRRSALSPTWKKLTKREA